MQNLSSVIGISLALLVSGAAWAQEPPTKTTPDMPSSSAPPSAPPTAQRSTAGEMPRFIAMQQGNERLASELKGLSVKNNADETIGNISDLVIGADGKVTAILIGVGGFLGIGASDVGVPFEPASLSTDSNGNRIYKLNANRETFEKAPKYVTVKAKTDAEKARQPSPGTSNRPSPGQGSK